MLLSICACLFIVGHPSFLLGCKLPKCWGARMCSPTLQLQHLPCKGKDLFFSKIIPRERVSPVFYNTQKPTKQEVMLLKASLVIRNVNSMESWSCSLLKVGSRLKTWLAGKSSRGLFREHGRPKRVTLRPADWTLISVWYCHTWSLTPKTHTRPMGSPSISVSQTHV